MNSINMDISSKCGEIFRKDNGVYEFICFHCAEQFESINQIISHIDSHFYDDSGNYLTTIIKEEPNIKFEECTIIEHLNLKEDDDDDDQHIPYELTTDLDAKQQTYYDYNIDRISPPNMKQVKRSKRKQKKTNIGKKKKVPPVKRVICDICNYACYYLFQMKMHMETHSNLKTYKCKLCQKGFNQSKNLTNHEREYHSEKTTCPSCGKQFQFKGNFVKHKKHCMPPNFIQEQDDPNSTKSNKFSNTKRFICDVCEYSCHFLFQLRIHMETHSNLRSYKCKTCPRTFNQAKNLINHEREFHSEKISCQACGKKFQFKGSLMKHQKNHCKPSNPVLEQEEALKRKLVNKIIAESGSNAGGAKHVCNICYRRFWCPAKLKEHQAKHSELIETCQICGNKYESKSQLEQHTEKVHGFKCDICDALFLSQQLLEEHFSQFHALSKQEVLQHIIKEAVLAKNRGEKKLPAHLENDEISYTCRECNHNTSPLAAMDEHMQIHTKVESYQCLLCQKMHKKPSSLKQHMRIHTDIPEKPFRCEVCHRSFRFVRYLAHHVGIHDKEKKYPCTMCDKTFRQPTELTVHTRVHLNIRDFQCYVCGRVFLTSGHLKYHIKDHTDGPFYCPHCNKEYSTRKSLRAHIVIHTDTRPYQCKQCGSGFKRHSTLRRHEETHSEEKKYKCRMCDMAFSVDRSRYAHEKNIHQLLATSSSMINK